MARIRTDDSLWPLVIMTFEDRFANEDLEQCFEDNVAFFRRGTPFASIRDCSKIRTMPTAVQREMAVRWHKRVRDEFPPMCLGVGVVSDSSIMRGVLTAINWIVTPPTPEALFPDMSGAVDWCIAKLEDRNVPIPFKLRSYALEITAPMRMQRAR